MQGDTVLGTRTAVAAILGGGGRTHPQDSLQIPIARQEGTITFSIDIPSNREPCTTTRGTCGPGCHQGRRRRDE